MTATTYFHKYENGFLSRFKAGAKSLGEKYIAARQKQAEAYVNAYLSTLDDRSLNELGIDRKTLKGAPKAFLAD